MPPRSATASITSAMLPLSLPWVTIRIVGFRYRSLTVASAVRWSLARSARHAHVVGGIGHGGHRCFPGPGRHAGGHAGVRLAGGEGPATRRRPRTAIRLNWHDQVLGQRAFALAAAHGFHFGFGEWPGELIFQETC